jgi:hypothetical protein
METIQVSSSGGSLVVRVTIGDSSECHYWQFAQVQGSNVWQIVNGDDKGVSLNVGDVSDSVIPPTVIQDGATILWWLSFLGKTEDFNQSYSAQVQIIQDNRELIAIPTITGKFKGAIKSEKGSVLVEVIP